MMIKPDGVALGAGADLAELLAPRSLNVEDVVRHRLSTSEIDALYAMDPSERPLTYMLHSVCLSSREAEFWICSGANAVAVCLESKHLLRSRWGNGVYANVLHSGESTLDVSTVLSILRGERLGDARAGLKLPDIWNGWSREEIWAGATEVWSEATLLTRSDAVLWAPESHPRQRARTRTKPADRLFWSWLSRYWPG